MKSYPSIPGSWGQSFEALGNVHVFDKLDGSNLRFEVTRKKGLTKHGTRNCLFDASDTVFGSAIQVFEETLLDHVSQMVQDNKWDSVIVFGEFWGPSSFAGAHEPNEPKNISLFDINPYKQGILPPKEFLKLTKYMPFPLTVKYLGQHNWTRGLVDQIWEGNFPGITLEGVVAKAGPLKMAKAKTKKWRDMLYARYTTAEALKLLNS